MTRKMVILVCLLLLFTLSSMAQGKAGNGTLIRPKPNRSPIKMVEGKVAEIDESKVIIENDHGARKELRLNSKTKFKLGEKKTVKLNEMKPGTFVKITFNETDLTVKKVEETNRKFRDE